MNKSEIEELKKAWKTFKYWAKKGLYQSHNDWDDCEGFEDSLIILDDHFKKLEEDTKEEKRGVEVKVMSIN